MKFEEISQSEIQRAIEKLISEGSLRKTDYAAWWQGKLISPSKIITKHYELIGTLIERSSFTTNDAQRTLLSIGIPIVDTTKNTDFFSSKELKTFSAIIGRNEYDSENVIDQNIKRFFQKQLWPKMKKWGRLLEKDGKKSKGRHSWNVMRNNNDSGQGYRPYHWLKIYPQDNASDDLYFTIGCDTDGLFYKLDIKDGSKEFSQELKQWFYEERKRIGADWRSVDHSNIDDYSWKQLVNETEAFIEKFLEDYYRFEEILLGGPRLMRLTWNTNQWQTPIGHDWEKENQGNSNIAYENQYGFGHEEWLFNPRYEHKGYQYGTLRGADELPQNVESVSQVLLFTIDPKSKDRFIVGRINDVEIIEGFEEKLKQVQPLFNEYLPTMVEELKEVEAEHRFIVKNGFIPNVRFKNENKEIFSEKQLMNELKGNKYNRFNPYRIEGSLKALLDKEIQQKPEIVFDAGFNKTNTEHFRKGGKKVKHVKANHVSISEALYKLLLETNHKDTLSFEKTKVGTCIIDGVINKDEKLTIFEIKTRNTTSLNIREAMGQLLEYAFVADNKEIEKLIIVGPSEPNDAELAYLKRLNKIINKPLQYWSYSFGTKQFKKH